MLAVIVFFTLQPLKTTPATLLPVMPGTARRPQRSLSAGPVDRVSQTGRLLMEVMGYVR